MDVKKITVLSVAIALLAACGGGDASGRACVATDWKDRPFSCTDHVGSMYDDDSLLPCSGEDRVAACPVSDTRIGLCKIDVGTPMEEHNYKYDEYLHDPVFHDQEDHEEKIADFKKDCEERLEGVWSK